MRVRIASTSCSHCARSARSARMRRTISAPWSGGIDHRPRAELHQLAEDGIGGRRGGADDVQRADALAIQPEVLRAGDRAHQLRQLRGEQAQAEGIGLQAIPEALIRHVDEGQQPAALHQLEHRAPLIGRKVRAGRVVAGGVQQHHRARGAASPAPPAWRRTAPRRCWRRSTGSARAAAAHRTAAARGSPRWACSRAPTVAGAAWRMSSAPRRSAPQPPGVCTLLQPPGGEHRVRGAEDQLLHLGVEARVAGGSDVGLGGLLRQ